MKKLSNKSTLAFLFLFFSLAIVYGASAEVDPTFDPAISREIGQANVTPGFVTQSDGKVLVFSFERFNTIAGRSKNRIARLNIDGSLDSSFTCNCQNFDYIHSAAVQPDGKIIVAGGFNFSPRIARLNSNGSVDYSFVSPFTQQGGSFSYSVRIWGVHTDGTIYASLGFGGFRVGGETLYRLNSNGSIDTSFANLGFNSWCCRQVINKLEILPDGKLMIGGFHDFGFIFRVKTDGTRDNTFVPPSLVTGQFNVLPYVSSFGIQSDGKVVITGFFTEINGVTRVNHARLNADGSVDLLFPVLSTGSRERLAIVSNDKILIGGDLGSSFNPLWRLNADGTGDNTFNSDVRVTDWKLDSSGRIVHHYGMSNTLLDPRFIGRLSSDGSADSSFTPARIGINGSAQAMSLKNDGTIFVGGNFTAVRGETHQKIAKLGLNGNTEAGFDSGSGFDNSSIYRLAVQIDGKILVGGNFFSYNGTTKSGLLRLHPDGTLDSGFSTVLSRGAGDLQVRAVDILPNGKILIGGNFSTVNGSSQSGTALLNSDGTLDSSFHPIFGDVLIYEVQNQADGKILVGGSFSGVNGFNRNSLVRLNQDGSLDSSFNADGIGWVNQIFRFPDGKYLVLNFSSIRKLNSNGTVDGSFQPPTFSRNSGGIALNRFAVLADGSIVIGGLFERSGTTVRNNIARFRSDGVLDTLLFTSGANGEVFDLAVQTDGMLIVAGNFNLFENEDRSSMARVSIPVFSQRTNFDFDGDGKADVAVFRPSENKWYIFRSSDFQVDQHVFAIPGDIPTPADYDGDGLTDIGIFRPANGGWWYLSTLTGIQTFSQTGQNGDVPRPSDFDGDGKADNIAFTPSTSNWTRFSSVSGQSSVFNFGISGDKPLIGDVTGDGKSDLLIYRPSTGVWWWRSSADFIFRATHWGIDTDIPAPADYDGDGKTDLAVYRPSTGVWYILNSATGQATIVRFGLPEDKPVAADYDGDGKADIAVFRPSTGVWYLLRSTQGFAALQFGISTDIPIPNSFVQ
jgi:uncharacterized delta-60 repeat protein